MIQPDDEYLQTLAANLRREGRHGQAARLDAIAKMLTPFIGYKPCEHCGGSGRDAGAPAAQNPAITVKQQVKGDWRVAHLVADFLSRAGMPRR